jgi:hypothetical protein
MRLQREVGLNAIPGFGYLRISTFGVKRAIRCLGAREAMDSFRDLARNREIESLALKHERHSDRGQNRTQDLRAGT